MMGKSHLTKLVTFDQTTGLVNVRRAVDVVYLDVTETLDALFHDIPLEKLPKYGLDKWKVSWIETKGLEGCN